MNGLRLFLFDLDGTLVTTGGAGVRALNRAVEEHYGVKGALKAISPAGKTDPAIFREVIRLFFKRDMDSAEWEILSEEYLRHLAREINDSKSTRPLKGVLEFLEHIAERPDIAVGLGTGNLERGARIKLSPTPLNPHFAFGGFGSDAEERHRLLQAGHRKAEARRNQTIPNHSVYIIGDTQLDVAAARLAGYRAVAVASGGASYETLENSKPDYLLKDMSEAFDWLRNLDAVEAVCA